MTIDDCVSGLGRAMGDAVFTVFSRARLVPTTIALVIINIILTVILADQAGSQMKELEINTFTTCKIRTITSMLEPVAQNLTDEISTAPCFFNKKHPLEVLLGASPKVDPVLIGVCVVMWVSILVFAMALIYGRD